MCVVGIRRNSTSMRGSRSHLYRLLSALRRPAEAPKNPDFGVYLGGEEKFALCECFLFVSTSISARFWLVPFLYDPKERACLVFGAIPPL